MHVELPHAPGLVYRGDVDADIFGEEFRMQRVYIVALEIDHPTQDAGIGPACEDKWRMAPSREIPR